jgi:hypothetical protein
MAPASHNHRAGSWFGTPPGLALLVAITATLVGTGTWARMSAEIKGMEDKLVMAHSQISQANKIQILSEWQACKDNPVRLKPPRFDRGHQKNK